MRLCSSFSTKSQCRFNLLLGSFPCLGWWIYHFTILEACMVLFCASISISILPCLCVDGLNWNLYIFFFLLSASRYQTTKANSKLCFLLLCAFGTCIWIMKLKSKSKFKSFFFIFSLIIICSFIKLYFLLLLYSPICTETLSWLYGNSFLVVWKLFLGYMETLSWLPCKVFISTYTK